MNAKLLQFILRSGLVAGAMGVLPCTGLFGAETNALSSDAFPNFESYIKVSGQGASVTGDAAAFQNRTKQSKDGGYGVEDFFYSKDTSKDANLQLTGHALAGTEDYLGQIDWSKTDVCKVEIGYKRFRTFYDGVGGFFPAGININPVNDVPKATTINKLPYTPVLNNIQWAPLANEVLNLDRGKFWFNATVALPNAPVFTLNYVNETRIGQKDSTIWGDSAQTGLVTNTGLTGSPIASARKFMPSWMDVNERHQNLEATVTHTMGNVTASLTAFDDKTDNLDTRYVVRYPGETKILSAPALAGTVLVSSINANNQIQQQQTDGSATKTAGVRGKVDVVITEKLKLEAGGLYQELNSDLSGDRTLVTATPTSTTTIPTGPASPGVAEILTDNNQNLIGLAKVKELKGNVALDWNITSDLFAKVGFRAEQDWNHASSTYNVLAASGTPAVTVVSTPRRDWSKVNQKSSTPVLDLRYNGIKDLALYFSGSKRSLNGTEKDTSAYNPLTAVLGTAVNNNVTEDHGDYTLGANWRQSGFLTLRAEGFQKSHQDQAIDTLTVGGPYNYLLDTQYKGFKVTAICKPLPVLSFTTRYIHQAGTMQVTGYPGTTPTYDSGNVKNYNIAETIDYTPTQQFYVQANVGAVYNTISTIYPNAGLTAATPTSLAFDSSNILQNSNNNYQTASLLVGFVAGKHTDVQAQYTGYRANNGNTQLAAWTMPYGVSARDSMVTVGIKHQINDKLILRAKIGYLTSANDTTGGMTNYHGPLAYISFEHAL